MSFHTGCSRKPAAFANWPLHSSVSQNGTSDGVLSTKRKKKKKNRPLGVKQLRVPQTRGLSKKALTGNDTGRHWRRKNETIFLRKDEIMNDNKRERERDVQLGVSDSTKQSRGESNAALQGTRLVIVTLISITDICPTFSL